MLGLASPDNKILRRVNTVIITSSIDITAGVSVAFSSVRVCFALADWAYKKRPTKLLPYSSFACDCPGVTLCGG